MTDDIAPPPVDELADGDPVVAGELGPQGIPGGDDAGATAEREKLIRQLRDTRMQLAMTEARVAALQQSATMQLGKAFVDAAKRPWPRGARLPRDLYRMWKDRGAPGKSGGATLAAALAKAQLADLQGTGARFLSIQTAPGVLSLADPALVASGVAAGAQAPALVITGALTPLACATLAPDAVVHPLLPHDADVVIEATGADLVLIEAAALLPGSPWAYATDSAGADRGRRLARMIVMARSLGKPVVLVRNVPPALLPGLGWVATSCDVVWDGGLGVQFARFNPVGVSATRSTRPLYAGDRDPREAPAVRTLLDHLTASSVPNDPSFTSLLHLTGARSWRALPELYRGGAVFVTASPEQAREQLACGARVIGPVASGTSVAEVEGQLAAASAAPPLDAAQIRAALREVFTAHATPVKLAGLAKAAGLADGVSPVTGGRQLAVLASIGEAAEAGPLAAGLLGQRLRPAEVLIGAASGLVAAVSEALAPLRDAGIRVRVTDVPEGAERSLARLASSPWVAPVSPGEPLPDTYLLDLACARECAQADAAGFGAADFELTQWLAEPALARRELFLPGSPSLDAWGAHGLRLVTITR